MKTKKTKADLKAEKKPVKDASEKSTEKKDQVILLAGLGGTPAVITETVWEMGVRGELPDEVIVLTTTRGASGLERDLRTKIGSAPAIWNQMLSALEAKGVDVKTLRTRGIQKVVFSNGEGELPDLRTEDENLQAANIMLRTIVGAQRSGTRLVVSIAGGRKTMSALLLSCMNMVGREQDRIYHVLIDPKHEVPMDPPFYFPGQGEKHQLIDMPSRKAKIDPATKKPFPKIPSSAIKVELFNVPYVRIRRDLSCFKQGEIPSYIDLVKMYQNNVTDWYPKIVVDYKQGSVFVDGKEVTLKVNEFVCFLLLHRGYLTGKDLAENLNEVRKAVEAIEAKLKSGGSGKWLSWFDDCKNCKKTNGEVDVDASLVNQWKSSMKKAFSSMRESKAYQEAIDDWFGRRDEGYPADRIFYQGETDLPEELGKLLVRGPKCRE